MRTNGKRPRPHMGMPAAHPSPRVPRSEFMSMTLEGGAMKKVAILPGVFLAALLFSGPGVPAAGASTAAPGDVSNAVPRLAQPSVLAPAPSVLVAESAPPKTPLTTSCVFRSEERRVGKECKAGRAPYEEDKKNE